MKKKHIILTIIVFILSFAFFLTSETLAKYVSMVTRTATLGVAVPIIDDNASSIPVQLSLDEPGDMQEYFFYVTNEKDSYVSDVSLDYVISINDSNNLPLQYELFKDGSLTNQFTNNISQTYTLNHSVVTSHNYRLVITWPSNENDYRLSNLAEEISISVNATQII